MNIDTLRVSLAKLQDVRSSPALRHELDALGSRLGNVQQLLHSTDPDALAVLKGSLGQVSHTFHVALDKAQRCLSETAPSGGHWPGTDSSRGPLDPRQCLIDVQECVLLIEFTVKVLSFPASSPAQRETEDLRTAARILHDAQRRSGDERLKLLRSQRSSSTYSSQFQIFIGGVLELESNSCFHHPNSVVSDADQPHSTGVVPRPRRVSDRDELYLPAGPSQRQALSCGEALPSCAESRTRFRQASHTSTTWDTAGSRSYSSLEQKALPPRPPKEPVNEDTAEITSTPRQQITRRPVARASTTPVSSTTSSPSSSQTLFAFLDRRRSQTMSTRLKPRQGRRTGTRELFTQASRSLVNLTSELETDDSPRGGELPPPYVESAPSAPLQQDAKRPHAVSISSTTSQNPSTFALIQDNLYDRLQERVKQGLSVNEIDPLTKRTALMEAANLERVNMVSTMLKASNQIHLKDLDGNSALHFAASHGNAKICEALLESGGSVEEYNNNAETPISLAAKGGHTDAVNCLLNSWTIQRGSAAALTKGYLESLKSGNVNTVAAFVERHIKPKKIKESVQCAAEGGSVPTLDYVLAQKANLKQRSPDGWSALHFAAERGHVAMVEKLLALGLSWKAQTKKIGETALAIAVRNRQIATANALILHKDAKVNKDDNDGVTPLHHAARMGDLGLVTTLLNAGAKLDVHSKYGWSVMHTAAAYGHTHLVAELITRGVSVEEKLTEADVSHGKKTNEGARRGYWAEIRWPHVNARALHLSLEFGYDEVANLLIAAGARIDAADAKGWRPLHYASFSVRPVIVELLLSRGASPHATTDDNNTPLSLGFRAHRLPASEEDKIRVWELLQGAMNATKKSKLKQFSDFMSSSSAGRQVEKRNKVWHTAELAALLHYEEQAEDEASESSSEVTLSTNDQRRDDVNGQDNGQATSRTSFGQDVKATPR